MVASFDLGMALRIGRFSLGVAAKSDMGGDNMLQTFQTEDLSAAIR